MESEKEWSDNKKLIDLGQSRKGIRSAVPKGFPYFAVNFGLQPGYAHIVEKEKTFPDNFGQVSISYSNLILKLFSSRKLSVACWICPISDGEIHDGKHLKK